MRLLMMLVPLVVMACSRSAPVDQLPAIEVQLESLYIDSTARLATEGLPARSVGLQLTGRTEAELRGTLRLDPNACSLDAFGDRQACTKIAVRGIAVAVRRMTITDPANPQRRSSR